MVGDVVDSSCDARAIITDTCTNTSSRILYLVQLEPTKTVQYVYVPTVLILDGVLVECGFRERSDQARTYNYYK